MHGKCCENYNLRSYSEGMKARERERERERSKKQKQQNQSRIVIFLTPNDLFSAFLCFQHKKIQKQNTKKAKSKKIKKNPCQKILREIKNTEDKGREKRRFVS